MLLAHRGRSAEHRLHPIGLRLQRGELLVSGGQAGGQSCAFGGVRIAGTAEHRPGGLGQCPQALVDVAALTGDALALGRAKLAQLGEWQRGPLCHQALALGLQRDEPIPADRAVALMLGQFGAELG